MDSAATAPTAAAAAAAPAAPIDAAAPMDAVYSTTFKSKQDAIRACLIEHVEYLSLPPASSQGTSLPTTPSPRSREWAKWPGFERYTGGQDTRAWWQQYGYRVEDRSTSRQGNRLKWICADCFARGFKKKSDFCFVCSTGAAIKKHLRNAHGILAPNDVAGGVRASSLDGRPITHFIGADFNNPHDQLLVSKLRGRFNSKGLRVLLLDWITYHNLPFDIVNTERFQRLLLYGNPLLDATHIPSGKTLLRMLESEYRGAVGPVTEVLRTARSQVHFSFDGWTSKFYPAFLGVNAQLIDHNFAQHRILLGLRPLLGKHNGASLADEVADTLAFWQVNNPDTVGYFTLDNAANNDTCMEDLAFEHGFSPEERRIRCAAHILNLCVRAMLYGSKQENFAAIVAADGDDLDDDEEQVDQAIDEALNGEMEDGTDEDPGANTAVEIPDEDLISSHPAPEEINAATFREYSQNGAPGILHNIGLQLRNTQLYEQFLQSQRKESGHGTTLHWAFNNATRWNSDMRMMERALRLRPALNTFFNDVSEPYRLSAYDWKVIEVLVKLLKPFEISTKQLQGSGVPGGRSTCGSFDEYFPVFEILLDHLESAIEGTIFEEVEDPVTREKKDVELGWKKLHKYYSRLTSAAYVGAVVFNPAKKWRLLDQLWSRYRERDVDNEVLATSDEASMDYIERRLARTVAASPFNQGSFGASGARKSNRKTKPSTAGATGDDEYARYCAEDVVNSHHYRSRPIDWWKINRSRYPRLSLMAVDMLTIPSTSAESERTFSSAGRMTAPLRSRLRREIVAMAQCIRSWSKAGIYRPSLPLFSLNEDQWINALASLKGRSDI
ncbi:Ribonuclease H-like protein [Hirsutella rhossiliensis]|uniref:Ribonuclease H-like protein n=1 Tax=Hirsutella rhossiliensis TaxID=111463 RepID=A0A9P8N3M6_9HYPO|nr:Ribonuclease H-like protein [Hirsutella rhossiliensis]KAH0966219.1 Ribonuclease H-like protein [Hirsutella rhossiliensis]